MSKKVLSYVPVLTLLIASGYIVQAQKVRPSVIPNAYIVKVADGVDVKWTATEVARRLGGRVKRVYTRAFRGFAIHVPPGVKGAALLDDLRIIRIEPDLKIPLPPFPQTGLSRKGGRGPKGQEVPAGVKRIGAHLNPVAKIDGVDERVEVDIAILDTGIDSSHPDLYVFGGANCTGLEQACVEDEQGYQDDNGHGTHVAGIAAAIDNDIGVVGVAPGARLWAVKTHNHHGIADLSDVIAGIDWITGHDIEVANMSFGRFAYDSSLRDAIKNSVAQGIVYVAAAGNSSEDIYGLDGVFNEYSEGDDFIPAAYPEVAAVSAMADSDGEPGGSRGRRAGYLEDTIVSWSNYSTAVCDQNPVTSGGAAIDLAAPGVSVYSTALGGGYVTYGGTSMAAPHVTGAVALYIAAYGRADDAVGVAQIRQALIVLAEPQDQWREDGLMTDPDTNPEGLVNVREFYPIP